MNHAQPRKPSIPVIAAAVALNVVLTAVVQALHLPIFVDAVGTIVAALLLGFWRGILVGVISFGLAAIVVSPVYVYFIGTQAVIAAYAYLMAKYFRGFASLPRVVMTGIGLGIVAGVVSAPVIVLVFGGATGSGRDLITAAVLASGQQIVKAVALSGIASEPIDKTIQCLLAYSIIRGLPDFVRTAFSNPVIDSNFPRPQ